MPRSKRPVCDFITDVHRTDWHAHCPNIRAKWELLQEALRGVLGDEHDLTKMGMPSGPEGAVLGIMWHYPTNNTLTTNITHGHAFVSALYQTI
jgi:hypothetical protein